MRNIKKIGLQYFCLLQVGLFLISAIGFSIDIHYCGGEINSVGIYTPAENCEMDAETDLCGHQGMSEIAQKSCCHNVQYDYQNELAERQSTAINLSSKLVLSLAENPINFLNRNILTDNAPSFKGHAPPLIAKDLNVLFDTFLI